MNGAVKLAIVGAIVALACVGGVIVTATVLSHGVNAQSTPVITTILGVIGTTIASLLALLAVAGVDRKVNGHIARLTDIATAAAAQTGDPGLAQKADEARAIANEATRGEVTGE